MPPHFAFAALVCVVTAAISIANIVKTSLGPVGLDKMLVVRVVCAVRVRVRACAPVCRAHCSPLYLHRMISVMSPSLTTVPPFSSCSMCRCFLFVVLSVFLLAHFHFFIMTHTLASRCQGSCSACTTARRRSGRRHYIGGDCGRRVAQGRQCTGSPAHSCHIGDVWLSTCRARSDKVHQTTLGCQERRVSGDSCL